MTKQDFTFERYPEIAVEEVRFENRYGTEDRGIVEAPGREAYSGEVRERLFQLGRSA